MELWVPCNDQKPFNTPRHAGADIRASDALKLATCGKMAFGKTANGSARCWSRGRRRAMTCRR